MLDELREEGSDFGIRHEKAEYGWNWLEHWMSSQSQPYPYPYPRECSYITPATTTTATATDDMSEKTVEMDPIALAQLNLGSVESGPAYSSRQKRQSISKNNGHVPSYMAPTQSAKAKVKVRSRGSACESSSSGGGTVGYQGPRSPTPINTGTGTPSHMLQLPSGQHQQHWALPIPPWRPAFASFT